MLSYDNSRTPIMIVAMSVAMTKSLVMTNCEVHHDFLSASKHSICCPFGDLLAGKSILVPLCILLRRSASGLHPFCV